MLNEPVCRLSLLEAALIAEIVYLYLLRETRADADRSEDQGKLMYELPWRMVRLSRRIFGQASVQKLGGLNSA